MAILVQERAGKLLDEGIFYEKQEIKRTDFEYQIDPIGHLSAIGSYNVPSGIIDKERIADFGMFHAAIAGKISKDEVVGATIMLPVREI
jgi:hypothetical protein